MAEYIWRRYNNKNNEVVTALTNQFDKNIHIV